jgi:predicted acylesterase/phospholipase RssA
MKTALVLTHGGAKGSFQVGVLKELVNRGIIPDVVLGGSIGAVNGAIFLSSNDFKKNMDLMENLWKKIRRKDVLTFNPEFFYKFLFSKSVYSFKGLDKLLKFLFPKDNFSFLSRKFYIVATRKRDAEPVFFSSGKLREKILVSCSVPAIFPPKKIKGVEYIDAGICGISGIKKAEELGCKNIILVNISSDPYLKKVSLYSKLMGLMDSFFLNNTEREIKTLNKSKVLEIRIGKKYSGKFDDFNSVESLIEKGQKDTKRILDKKKIFSMKDFV